MLSKNTTSYEEHFYSLANKLLFKGSITQQTIKKKWARCWKFSQFIGLSSWGRKLNILFFNNIKDWAVQFINDANATHHYLEHLFYFEINYCRRAGAIGTTNIFCTYFLECIPRCQPTFHVLSAYYLKKKIPYNILTTKKRRNFAVRIMKSLI